MFPIAIREPKKCRSPGPRETEEDEGGLISKVGGDAKRNWAVDERMWMERVGEQQWFIGWGRRNLVGFVESVMVECGDEMGVQFGGLSRRNDDRINMSDDGPLQHRFIVTLKRIFCFGIYLFFRQFRLRDRCRHPLLPKARVYTTR